MSLITIDQLLESVDLDFEPRFITKDLNGIVNIWSEKPHRRSTDWDCSAYATVYEGLKLAEFDGKNWTECIYEVPQQKKVEKIEKLDLSIPNNKMLTEFDQIEIKINELVDAVNELKGAKNE